MSVLLPPIEVCTLSANSSYSFIPILLKLHWCFGHGLKICMWFGYNPQIIFCPFFSQIELSHFSGIIYNNVNGQGYIVGATPPTVFIRILLKLHWCFGHGLKICMWFGYNPQIIFCPFFRKLNLAFSGIIYNNMNGQGIPCGRNSSNSFIPILLKLHWCFDHGLKICMWFGYNPQIIFCPFFRKLNLSFSGIIYNNVNGQGIPCWRNSSYSFIPILLKQHWCFGHGLKICMWFGYNPQIIFCPFFRKLNLAIFRALSITM